MASTRASISKASKRPKINILPPSQLFVDLTQDDTKTPSPKLQLSSPSAPNAPSKTPSTKDTSSSSIDYIPKSPTSSTSLSPNGYFNPPISSPPRVSPPPPTQENASIDITLTFSPITPLDVQFNTPSPSPPIRSRPSPRLTPDAFEARADWWISSRAFFDGPIREPPRILSPVNLHSRDDPPVDIYRRMEEQDRALKELKENNVAHDDMYNKMNKFLQEVISSACRRTHCKHTAEDDLEVFSTDDLGLDWISVHNFLTRLQKLSSYTSGHLEVSEKAACLEKASFSFTPGHVKGRIDINIDSLRKHSSPEAHTLSLYRSRNLCKLNKSLYGLKQAPRQWNAKLTSALLENDFVQSKSDYSLFTESFGGVFIALLVYVDDIIITGNSLPEINKVKQFLKTKFMIKDLGKLKYFLGIEVLDTSNGVCLNQRKYCLELIDEFGLLVGKPSYIPMQPNISLTSEPSETGPSLENVFEYQKLIGKLIYLTTTRPDIAYTVSCLSQFIHSPLKSHLKTALKVIRYLKGSPDKGINVIKGSASGIDLKAYSDADWARFSFEKLLAEVSKLCRVEGCILSSAQFLSWVYKLKSGL
ncbi:ribonuclease H-like domain-containing protein [Tanacetum coccineum]